MIQFVYRHLKENKIGMITYHPFAHAIIRLSACSVCTNMFLSSERFNQNLITEEGLQDIMKTQPCNIQRFFQLYKIKISKEKQNDIFNIFANIHNLSFGSKITNNGIPQ